MMAESRDREIEYVVENTWKYRILEESEIQVVELQLARYYRKLGCVFLEVVFARREFLGFLSFLHILNFNPSFLSPSFVDPDRDCDSKVFLSQFSSAYFPFSSLQYPL